MKLTTTETKLLEKLRKQETAMFRYRRWFVATGILNYAAAGYIGFVMQHLSWKPPEIGFVFFSVFFPLFLVIGFLGSCFLGIAIRDWNGNANRVLLIKLVDENMKNVHDQAL